MANYFLIILWDRIAIILNSFLHKLYLKGKQLEISTLTSKNQKLEEENQGLLTKHSELENQLFLTGTADIVYEIVADINVPPNHPNFTQPQEIQSVPIYPQNSIQPQEIQSVPINPKSSTQPQEIQSVPINPHNSTQPQKIQSVPINPQTQPQEIQFVPINPQTSTQSQEIQSFPINPQSSTQLPEIQSFPINDVYMEDFQTVHQDNDPKAICPETCCPEPSNSSGCKYQTKTMKKKDVHCYSAVCRKGDPKKVKKSHNEIKSAPVIQASSTQPNKMLDVNSNSFSSPTDSNSNEGPLVSNQQDQVK